jgi:hypothetical protein
MMPEEPQAGLPRSLGRGEPEIPSNRPRRAPPHPFPPPQPCLPRGLCLPFSLEPRGQTVRASSWCLSGLPQTPKTLLSHDGSEPEGGLARFLHERGIGRCETDPKMPKRHDRNGSKRTMGESSWDDHEAWLFTDLDLLNPKLALCPSSKTTHAPALPSAFPSLRFRFPSHSHPRAKGTGLLHDVAFRSFPDRIVLR